MKEIIKTLNNIGLNKNQAKTYVTMLELGKASVIDICRVSGIARTTIYDNFRVLKSTGLATEVWEKGKKYFIAESPENIQKILEDKQKAVSGVITDLVKIFNVSKLKPRITIMNGKKGLIKMHQFSLIFNTNKRTRWLGEVDSLFSYLSEKFVKNYVKKRVEKGIRNQVLTTSKIFTRREMYSKQKNKENLREIKYLDEIGDINTAFFNFDDKVFLVSSSKEGFVIMIESEEFAETFSSIFNFLWKVGKEV